MDVRAGEAVGTERRQQEREVRQRALAVVGRARVGAVTEAPTGWGGGRGVVGGVGWRRQRVMAGDGRTREIKWRCSGTVP
jgi:hypothetical protein